VVVFGCERARSYLEHKEFELLCDNLALCWLFPNVKDVGRLGRWIICLAPFKFRVYHTKGTNNMAADSFRMFEGHDVSEQGGGFLATMQGLPLVYASLKDQKEDPLCKNMLEALKRGDAAAAKFRLYNNLMLSNEGCQKQTVRGSGDLKPNVVKILRFSNVRAFGLI